MNRQTGNVVLYALVVVVLMAIGPMLLLVIHSGFTIWSSLILGSLSSFVALILVFEYRRDWRTCTVFAASIIAIAGFVCACGFYVTFAIENPNPKWLYCAVGFEVLAGFGFLAVSRSRQLSESPAYPELARRMFGPDAIAEKHGVQLAVAAKEKAVIQVYLQNSWSASRQVEVTLTKADVLSSSNAPRMASCTRVDLGPAEFGVLEIPVIAPDGVTRFDVYVDISVSGIGGRRVRPWQAPTLHSRVTGPKTVFFAMFGVLASGGGMRVALRGGLPLQDDLPVAPVWKVLWAPEPGMAPLG